MRYRPKETIDLLNYEADQKAIIREQNCLDTAWSRSQQRQRRLLLVLAALSRPYIQITQLEEL